MDVFGIEACEAGVISAAVYGDNVFMLVADWDEFNEYHPSLVVTWFGLDMMGACEADTIERFDNEIQNFFAKPDKVLVYAADNGRLKRTDINIQNFPKWRHKK